MELTERQKALSKRLLDFLKRSRDDGRATPERPMTAKEIVQIASRSGVKMTTEDVNAIFRHYRRLPIPEPIASTNQGYFFAIDDQELIPTFKELTDKAIETFETRRGVRRAIDNLKARKEGDLFNHPVVKKLVDELDAVPVAAAFDSGKEALQ